MCSSDLVKNLLDEYGIDLKLYQDHVVFRPGDILKDDGKPYTVYTPFKNKWLRKLNVTEFPLVETLSNGIFYNSKNELPSLYSMGFEQSLIEVDDYKLDGLSNYEQERNLPAVDGTSKLGPHLRFGTVSIRSVVNSFKENPVLLSEIIWREFFIHILHHFPYSITRNFKVKYDSVKWLNNKGDFKKWCEGKTGYPIVDAGIRQLIQTGNMHNRVRMVVASFLCKHLLIDWRWGEAFFAKHLLDYELSSNVGNWQWVAGTGCDSAPYFRVFNPMEQQRKFDGAGEYIRKWVKDIDELTYPLPMVDHKMARSRAVETYKIGLS